MSDMVIPAFVVVGLFVLLICGAFAADRAACHAQWENAGMSEVRWKLVGGCMVKLPDGRWLPADRIREIDIPKEPK